MQIRSVQILICRYKLKMAAIRRACCCLSRTFSPFGKFFNICAVIQILRIDCEKAEEGLDTTPCSECALNALAIDNPLEYATLYLEGSMQKWIDAEDSLELW